MIVSEPSSSTWLGNVAAWAANVLSSVLIVGVNKILMASKRFHFATTLTALHFCVCSLAVRATQKSKSSSDKLPLQDLVLFTAVANASIISLNLSLMINSVSFYQVAKLLVIPFCCFVEAFFLHRTFTREAICAIGVVIGGVAMVTVQDLNLDVTYFGLALAATSVVASGMQQILVRTMQQKHGLTAHELLSDTAPMQALTLCAAGPSLDKLISKQWVFEYAFSRGALLALMASCGLAVVVNISQFVCLGRFSAVSFQVLGHTKTVLVLLGSWAFLGDAMPTKKVVGLALAVVGMSWYGKASMAARSSKSSPVPVEEEDELLELTGGLKR